MTYQSDKWADETHILIGTFKDPSPFKPASDFLVEERLGWVNPVAERS